MASSPATRVLTHSQKVTRLYRKSLKNLLSWIIYREVWRKEALELRAIFDDNKHVDMGEAVKLLEEGEALYQRHKHPDPYICELAHSFHYILIGAGTNLRRPLVVPPSLAFQHNLLPSDQTGILYTHVYLVSKGI